MTLRSNLSIHRVFVQKFGAKQSNDIMRVLNEAKELALKMFQTKSVDKEVLRSYIEPIGDIATTRISELVSYENQFITSQYQTLVNPAIAAVPIANVLKKVFTKTIDVKHVVKTTKGYRTTMKRGKSINAAYSQFGRNKADELYSIVNTGIYTQANEDDFVAQINTVVDNKFNAQSLVLALTAVNFSTNIVKDALRLANPEYIIKEQWVADIELNNCSICAALNDSVRDAGEFEQPPIHWNCGCEVIPYVES